MEIAVKKGGKKLDSYDGNHDFYIKNGFEPISWCKFDKQYAPSGWNGKEEDIIFYVYTGKKNSISLHDFKNKISYSVDYDMAQKTRDNLIVRRLKNGKTHRGFCRGFTQAIDNDPEIASIAIEDKTEQPHGYLQTEIETIAVLE